MYDETIARLMEERGQQLDALRRAVSEYERATQGLRELLAQHEGTLAALRQNTHDQETALDRERQEAERYDRLLHDMKAQMSEGNDALQYKIALAISLANAAYDVLLILDRDFRVIAINNAAEALFGRQRPIGEHLTDLTQVPQLLSIVEDALINAEESLEEQIVIDKQTFRVKVAVMRRDGNEFVSVAMQDISDLVRLARARRDMVANISHEMRTPITNIRLTIESLFHEQDKPKRKQSASALKAIAREVDSMQWLVQGMHDLSMIEAGEAMLRMTEFALHELVAGTIEQLSDLSESKEIPVVSNITPDVIVLADRDLTMRVLINLIHNALKWSPPKQPIEISAENQGDQVLISVRDHGPGVPLEHRERVFERFYQVDPARSRSEGSSGLGLAICKHIVEAHEGQIWVEDAEGGGAKFCFTLPNTSVL